MAIVNFTLILAASVGIHAGHGVDRGECRECGGADAVVQEKVEKLRTATLWVVRRKAARSLRVYDWRRHPEAAEALAGAVLNDSQSLVRQEAATSLGRMKPCLPAAHEALAFAAEEDPSLIARCAAKKALKAVGKGCTGACDVCEAGPSEFLSPGPSVTDELIVPSPLETSIEPLEPTSLVAPNVPATPSPFAPVETDGALPPPRRVQRPNVHPEDSVPLVAPSVPLDRYDPTPGELPTPADNPVPPTPAWPR